MCMVAANSYLSDLTADATTSRDIHVCFFEVFQLSCNINLHRLIYEASMFGSYTIIPPRHTYTCVYTVYVHIYVIYVSTRETIATDNVGFRY